MQLSRAGPRFKEILFGMFAFMAMIMALMASPATAIARATVPRIDTSNHTPNIGPPAVITTDHALTMTDNSLLGLESNSMLSGHAAGSLERQRCSHIAYPLDSGIAFDSGTSPPRASHQNVYVFTQNDLGRRRARSAMLLVNTSPISVLRSSATYDYGRAARMGRITPTRQDRSTA